MNQLVTGREIESRSRPRTIHVAPDTNPRPSHHAKLATAASTPKADSSRFTHERTTLFHPDRARPYHSDGSASRFEHHEPPRTSFRPGLTWTRTSTRPGLNPMDATPSPRGSKPSPEAHHPMLPQQPPDWQRPIVDANRHQRLTEVDHAKRWLQHGVPAPHESLPQNIGPRPARRRDGLIRNGLAAPDEDAALERSFAERNPDPPLSRTRP